MNIPFRLAVFSTVVLCGLNLPLDATGQGSITPPGPPGPVMKTLSQIEARTPISALPYAITNPGSYYLTGNLTGTSGTNGITIVASDVSIDLNGFALIGVPGSSNGISAQGTSVTETNLTVHNGIIRNWGGMGIHGFYIYNCALRDLTAEANGGNGLEVGSMGLIRNCIATRNGSAGIVSEVGGGLIIQCNAGFNSYHGIFASSAVVEDCIATGNGATGIYIYNYSKAENCGAYNNTDDGIALGYYCHALDNTCEGNNPSGSSSYGGIRTFFVGGRIEGNHIEYNAGYGILVSALGGGTQWLIVRNSTVGTKTNAYSIPAGNDVGPWGNAATATSPWANISN